jgi:F0F1-type ATP synthase assembly protein I
MSPEEPSLSDHEQRILAEIARNLEAEDPDFVRNVSQARPVRNSRRLIGLSVIGLVVGLLLLLSALRSLPLGVAGFFLMLGSVVGFVSGLRAKASGGRSPSSMFRDALRRAEDRMRSRRRDP